MLDKIFVEDKNEIRKIAGFKNGVLSEFVIQDGTKQNEGNIYLGKITKKIKTANGKEGYFVNTGGDREAFINAEERDLEDLKAHEGQDIVVQVTQEQRAEKGARMARFLHLAGIYLVYCPYGSEIDISNKITDEEKREEIYNLVAENSEYGGWIIRTHAAEADKDSIIEELKNLQNLFDEIISKAKRAKAPCLLAAKDNDLQEMLTRNIQTIQSVVVNNHLLEAELKDEFAVSYEVNPFEKAGVNEFLQEDLQKEVRLKCGGRVIIEETKAFVAIDVDSGEGAAQGGLNRVNQEAAAEIARQIVLRNLSGKIIIDFAGVSEFKFLKSSMDILQENLADDFAKAKVLGLSRAGNVEILRMRRKPSLSDLLTEECPTCRGTGRVEK